MIFWDQLIFAAEIRSPEVGTNGNRDFVEIQNSLDQWRIAFFVKHFRWFTCQKCVTVEISVKWLFRLIVAFRMVFFIARWLCKKKKRKYEGIPDQFNALYEKVSAFELRFFIFFSTFTIPYLLFNRHFQDSFLMFKRLASFSSLSSQYIIRNWWNLPIKIFYPSILKWWNQNYSSQNLLHGTQCGFWDQFVVSSHLETCDCLSSDSYPVSFSNAAHVSGH